MKTSTKLGLLLVLISFIISFISCTQEYKSYNKTKSQTNQLDTNNITDTVKVINNNYNNDEIPTIEIEFN